MIVPPHHAHAQPVSTIMRAHWQCLAIVSVYALGAAAQRKERPNVPGLPGSAMSAAPPLAFLAETNDYEFDKVVASNQTYLLAFGTQCDRCREVLSLPVKAVFESFAKNGVKVKFASFSIHKAPLTFERFFITKIPSFRLLLNGKVYVYGDKRPGSAQPCCFTSKGCKDKTKTSLCHNKVEEDLKLMVLDKNHRGRPEDLPKKVELSLAGFGKKMLKMLGGAYGLAAFLVSILALATGLALMCIKYDNRSKSRKGKGKKKKVAAPKEAKSADDKKHA